MSITDKYYDQAAELLINHHPDTTTHSEPYWEGYLGAVTWHLAGRPELGLSDSRYAPGTLQRDAWSYGWVSGQQYASQLEQTSA